MRTYYEHLGQGNEDDFACACQLIREQDDWFPTIRRILEVNDQFRRERRQAEREQAAERDVLVELKATREPV